MSDRQQQFEELGGKLANMKQNLKQLSARADLLDGDKKSEISDIVDRNRQTYAELAESYGQLQDAAEDEWQEVSDKIEDRLDKAAKEVKDAWERIS